MAVDLNYY